MRYLIEQFPPATWMAYSVLAAEREQAGAWPDPDRVKAVAQTHDADPWALLVLTRGELPELNERKKLTGDLVSVRPDADHWTRPIVLAPTPEALLALKLCATDLYCRVVDPWGRNVRPRDLDRYAVGWIETANANRLMPKRIEAPLLHAEARH